MLDNTLSLSQLAKKCLKELFHTKHKGTSELMATLAISKKKSIIIELRTPKNERGIMGVGREKAYPNPPWNLAVKLFLKHVVLSQQMFNRFELCFSIFFNMRPSRNLHGLQ